MFKNADGILVVVGEMEYDGVQFTGVVIGHPHQMHVTPADFRRDWTKVINLDRRLSRASGISRGRYNRTAQEDKDKKDPFGALLGYVPVAKALRGGD
jgi:hypothetical protein